MKKFVIGMVTSVVLALSLPAVALAHVIVTPGQAGIGQELVFNVSVPNERETPVTSIRLDIPKGVMSVTPTVTPGWTITTDGSGDNITAITWSGTIPVGQREDFGFGAQVPASSTELDWKAYQTYGDGTVVHWDQKPAGSDDATGNAGPYSVTKVINDLTSSTTTNTSSHSQVGPYIVAVGALIVAGAALLKPTRKR